MTHKPPKKRLSRALDWVNRQLAKLRHRRQHLQHRLSKRERTGADARVERILHEANRLIALGLHYVWGGGHGQTPAPANGPFDCSSYASRLGQVAVPGITTGTTFSLAGALPKGAGKYVTFFIKNDPSNDAHVIVRIIYKGKTYWTQCGGRDNTRAGGGPCFFKPTQSRINEFPIQVHPEGL